MKKLFIFDLDGTLLDTVADLGNSCNHVFTEAGFPTHPIDAYYKFVGNGIAKLIERALPADEATAENIEKLLPPFRAYYNLHMADDTKPYRGVCELIAELQQKGVAIAVASNKYQAATENLVKKYFPEINFVAVFGQRDNVPVKPDPAIVRDIQQAAGIVDTAEIIYIGDSLVDLDTAKNSNVEFVAVTWGFCPRESLAENNPAHIADTIEELRAVLIK
ncbi:MAG: HAD family hydrolase [Bacteroidaceae bacterium]|nr:HAD family hydrolase [Bacteroidaceae bacterium]